MRAGIIFFAFLMPLLGFSQARRAQSLIEKGKPAEAYDLLNRSINKDSLASSEHFVLASMFIDEELAYYNIDSAYSHIITARNDFAGLETKQQERLTGNGFDLTVYDTLKKYIETAGFVRAKGLGREEDYISFMLVFSEAEQLDSAVVLRDADAFRKASNENTYMAYQQFYKKYPDAIDVKEAQTRYQRLLYEEKTASGKLADLKEFLNEYPDTWHRKVVELEIFRIMTGKNSIAAYKQFLQEYPASHMLDKAKLNAYNLAVRDQRMILLDELLFTEEVRDSLQLLANLSDELLLLGHNGADFEVIRANGVVLQDSISLIGEMNKCEDLKMLIMLMEPGANRLLNLLGDEVFVGDFSGYTLIGEGFVKLKASDGDEIIHLAGSATTGRRYQKVMMVAGFLAYFEQDKWGLESITGIPMLEPSLDTLFEFNDQLIIAKAGQWGLLPIEDLYPLLDQGKVSFTLPYDSLVVVRDQQLLIQVGDKTGLLDNNLESIISLGEPLIELLEDGYFLETNDSILDSRLANVWYSDIRSNELWTIGERSTTHDLYYQGRKIAEVDKAELLGRAAVLVSKDDNNFCYFNAQSKITIYDGDEIKPVRKMGENSVIRHYLYTDQRKRQSVIDESGKRIKIPRFDRLIDLGEDYMIFSVKGYVYNILDNRGRVVLENVDAATSLDRGYISYLSKGKFGLLNIRNNTMLEAKYDKPLRRYDEERFIIEKDGRLGLINRYDSVYLDTKYEEIRPLNDSIAVLKANFRWTFWNINQGRIILDNVSDYWEYTTDSGVFFKIFKGIGYGIWQPRKGMILNSTYDELSIKANKDHLVFVTEKWVEEADLVILLYYNREGGLIRKSVLTTKQYEALQCQAAY